MKCVMRPFIRKLLRCTCYCSLIMLLMVQPGAQQQAPIRPVPESSAMFAVDPQCASSNPTLWSTECMKQTWQSIADLPAQQQKHTPAAAEPAGQQRTASCLTGRRRSALRVFMPASVQPTAATAPHPSNMSVIIQLAAPAANKLASLADTSYCGQDHRCLITASAPAAVLSNSMQLSGKNLAKFSIAVPLANATAAEKLQVTIQADPCNPLSTNTELEVNITREPTVARLQLLHPPSLQDNTFQVQAIFSSPIASFDVTQMDLQHTSVSSIQRSSNTSFTITCKGGPGQLASIQLKPRSYRNTLYQPGIGSNTVATQVPSLQNTLPGYGTAAAVLLPVLTGAIGFVCLLAVLIAPGSTLAGCMPTLLRTMGHMQLLAASASMSHAGLTGSYASAARDLDWALLHSWLPAQAVVAADVYTSGWTNRLVKAPPADTGTWTAAAADSSTLDSWLREMQDTSALIAAYDVSTATTARQLDALAVAGRVLQPQLPEWIVLQQDIRQPALRAWRGLCWSLGVTAGLLVLAALLHFALWLFSSSGIRQPRQGLVQPPAVQLPLLLLFVLLLSAPAVVHWSGCLAGTGQELWMVLAAMLGSTCPAAALYIWLLNYVLTTAEDALLGPEEPDLTALPAGGTVEGGQNGAAVIDGPQLEYVQRLQGPVAEAAAVHGACAAAANARSVVDPLMVEAALLAASSCRASLLVSRTAVARGQAIDATAGIAAAAAAVTVLRDNCAGVAQDVSDTMSSYEVQLSKFRRGAYLSMSLKSQMLPELEMQQLVQQMQQQQQQQQQEQNQAGAAAAAAAALLQAQQQRQSASADAAAAAAAAAPQDAISRPLGEANESYADRQYQYSVNGTRQQRGSDAQAAGAGVRERHRVSVEEFFQDASHMVDVEELQRQQILQEIREAQRGAQVRRKLRKQRLKPGAIIPPRELPPEPASPIPAQLMAAAVGAGLNVHQNQQGDVLFQRLTQAPGGYGAAGLPGGLQLNWDQRVSAAHVAARGRPISWLESIGLLQAYWGIECNKLVMVRLQYMSRVGVVLWDIVGSVGMADVQQEGDLLQAARPMLLVANVLFFAGFAVCCALLGTIGPALAAKEPQIWIVGALQVAWLMYIMGMKPFADLSVTVVEAMLATGQTLLVFCGLLCAWDQQGSLGQRGLDTDSQAKANMVAICALAGMVLLLTVVQFARLLVLLISVWHAWQYGGRRLRRVVPVASYG